MAKKLLCVLMVSIGLSAFSFAGCHVHEDVHYDHGGHYDHHDWNHDHDFHEEHHDHDWH